MGLQDVFVKVTGPVDPPTGVADIAREKTQETSNAMLSKKLIGSATEGALKRARLMVVSKELV